MVQRLRALCRLRGRAEAVAPQGGARGAQDGRRLRPGHPAAERCPGARARALCARRRRRCRRTRRCLPACRPPARPCAERELAAAIPPAVSRARAQIKGSDWDAFYEFYLNTVDKRRATLPPTCMRSPPPPRGAHIKRPPACPLAASPTRCLPKPQPLHKLSLRYGNAYLTRDFFDRLGATMADQARGVGSRDKGRTGRPPARPRLPPLFLSLAAATTNAAGRPLPSQK